MLTLRNLVMRVLTSWAVRPLLGVALSAVCLIALSRTGVSIEGIGKSLEHGNPAVLVPAVALYFVGLFVRSVRWGLLLPGRRLPPGLLFRTLVIGFMVNDLLPLRLGELARIVLLARNASTPVGVSFASIVVERVLDGLALIALLGLGMELLGRGDWLVQLTVASVFFVGLTVLLLGAALAPGLARAIAGAVTALLPMKIGEPLRRLVDGTLEGLRPITHPALGISVLALSLLAWGIEATMYVVIMAGFNVPDAIAAGPFGAAVANLATLVPSSPGYVGTFDLALQKVLVDVSEGGFGVFRVAPDVAASATLVIHLTFILPVVLLGLVFLWKEDLPLAQLARRPHALQKAVAGR
jgi:glycosyltransferase 2 family protein